MGDYNADSGDCIMPIRHVFTPDDMSNSSGGELDDFLPAAQLTSKPVMALLRSLNCHREDFKLEDYFLLIDFGISMNATTAPCAQVSSPAPSLFIDA